MYYNFAILFLVSFALCKTVRSLGGRPFARPGRAEVCVVVHRLASSHACCGDCGGGKGTKRAAVGCGSGTEQSGPTHPRWHLHKGKSELPVGGCTHSPCASQPRRHSSSSHVSPHHPASHRHSPCSHQPFGPQSCEHCFSWHHSPLQPSAHRHTPCLPSHQPCGALQPCIQREAVAHTEPTRPAPLAATALVDTWMTSWPPPAAAPDALLGTAS